MSVREPLKIAFQMTRWALLIVPVSIVTGCLVALFLWLLESATQFRKSNMWIVCFLPIAGVLIYWLYSRYGKNTEKGNDLILDTIHLEAKGEIPLRMAPLVLVTTVITHLFGGSAGREGTAIQMGGSIADFCVKKSSDHCTST